MKSMILVLVAALSSGVSSVALAEFDCSPTAVERTANYLWGASIRSYQAAVRESREDGKITPAESRANHALLDLQRESSELHVAAQRRPAAEDLRSDLFEAKSAFGQAGAELVGSGLKGDVLRHFEAVRKLIWGLEQCI